MTTALVHLLDSTATPTSLRVQAAILRQGHGLRLHADVANLCEALEKTSLRGGHGLALLAGHLAAVCGAAQAVRGTVPDARVVALVDQPGDARLLQAMRSGVDVCWPLKAPAALIATGLSRLARSGPDAASAALPDHVEGGWQLGADAWVMHAGGLRVPLTSAERAVLLALYRAPGNVLSHAAIAHAVNTLPLGNGKPPQAPSGAVATAQAAAAARRLGVLMSRLRRKFAVMGADMPIRSVRGVGYALIGLGPAAQAGAVVPVMPAAPVVL